MNGHLGEEHKDVDKPQQVESGLEEREVENKDLANMCRFEDAVMVGPGGLFHCPKPARAREARRQRQDPGFHLTTTTCRAEERRDHVILEGDRGCQDA